MKRIAGVLLGLLMAALMAAPAAAETYYPPPFEVEAEGIYLYNLDTDTPIAQKNMDEPMYPASLTKIMTCILALEGTANLDTETLTYPTYVQDYLYRYQYVDGNGAISLGGLMAGEELSMRQLLYALMLPSANEAAMIIADHMGGSQEEFAEMMTAKAREIGAASTTFVNANGLFHPEHVTTPADMAKIAMYAMDVPGFMEIVTTTSYDSGPTNLHPDGIPWDTTVKMQVANHESYYPGLAGIKTGSVPEAGDCLVSTCTRDGVTYLLVVMGADSLDEEGAPLPARGAFTATKQLYDWVFTDFRRKTLVDQGEHRSEIKVNLSMDTDYVTLMTGGRLTHLVQASVDVSDVTLEPDFGKDAQGNPITSIVAPVEKGQQIGELRVVLAGEEIGRVPLLAAESVAASPVLLLWERLKEIMSGIWFKFGVILLVLLVIFYAVVMILRNRNRRRNGYRPRRRI
jgi:D-alanyl-D-alanine carboxypeptidase (penicillin-binding protein 5/6)